MKEKELLALKKKIKDAEDKNLRLEGELASLHKRLKEEWKITKPKQIKDKLQEMKAELVEQDTIIKRLSTKLSNELNKLEK